MQKQPRSSFFSDTAFRVVTLALLLQAAAFYGFSRTEYEPNIAPLSTFPSTVGSFRAVDDIPVEQEVREVLKADDILNRNFVAPDGRPVNLFIAAFRSQRTGKAPHPQELPAGFRLGAAGKRSHARRRAGLRPDRSESIYRGESLVEESRAVLVSVARSVHRE